MNYTVSAVGSASSGAQITFSGANNTQVYTIRASYYYQVSSLLNTLLALSAMFWVVFIIGGVFVYIILVFKSAGG
jgi:hypothetical protein